MGYYPEENSRNQVQGPQSPVSPFDGQEGMWDDRCPNSMTNSDADDMRLRVHYNAHFAAEVDDNPLRQGQGFVVTPGNGDFYPRIR